MSLTRSTLHSVDIRSEIEDSQKCLSRDSVLSATASHNKLLCWCSYMDCKAYKSINLCTLYNVQTVQHFPVSYWSSNVFFLHSVHPPPFHPSRPARPTHSHRNTAGLCSGRPEDHGGHRRLAKKLQISKCELKPQTLKSLELRYQTGNSYISSCQNLT